MENTLDRFLIKQVCNIRPDSDVSMDELNGTQRSKEREILMSSDSRQVVEHYNPLIPAQ